MKTLIAALTVGTLVAAPAFAKPPKADFGSRSAPQAYAAVTPFGSPTTPGNAQGTLSTTREAALRECSVKSRQYTETTWNSMQAFQFRACMMQHGQPE